MNSNIIEMNQISYEYNRLDDDGKITGVTKALNAVDLQVEPGDFITILGHNGSGKSTLAKHINALLFPTEGCVIVDGYDTADEKNLLAIRQCAGMIFQNPDNQIIGTVVEEDVGFGPENMGVESKEIRDRVEESLKTVGMYEYRKSSPNKLSGGQKQRVSIAGVLAMHPKCIILDEPTAMLDPRGRREVIRAVRALNDVERITIILITHYMEEAIFSDRIFVMDHGEIVMQGRPKEIFSREEELTKYHLTLPVVTQIGCRLKAAGANLPDGILTRKELVSECLRKWDHGDSPSGDISAKESDWDHGDSPFGDISAKESDWDHGDSPSGDISAKESDWDHGDCPSGDISAVDLSFEYEAGTNMAVKALDGINLSIPAGQFVGIAGHTGSGKTTLVQLLDKLLKPTYGTVMLAGEDIYSKKYDTKKLRKTVGIVFQYPEYQLFEETVLKDVSFGPKNLGLSEREAAQNATEALKLVGIEENDFALSPFELSGGQKRRVAVAGVLAMHPQILILDEPTAGLDPEGRDEIFSLLSGLHEQGMTVILVSHSMEDIARYTERVIVLDHGKVKLDGTPADVFAEVKELEEIGLAVPEVTYIMRDLKAAGLPVKENITIPGDAVREILRALSGK